jgi:hypothetical protein
MVVKLKTLKFSEKIYLKIIKLKTRKFSEKIYLKIIKWYHGGAFNSIE